MAQLWPFPTRRCEPHYCPPQETVPDARSSLASLQAKNAYVSAATLSIHYQYVVDRKGDRFRGSCQSGLEPLNS
jgi:hypothetical protein